MKAYYQHKSDSPRRRARLFESPWVALYLLLRKEWMQYRSQSKGRGVIVKSPARPAPTN